MHSLCLNFYVAHYYVSRNIIPQDWAFAVYVAAALWVAWIGFSRVYMGMHTPIDIGGGALIAIMVLSSYLSIDGRSDPIILYNDLAPDRMRKLLLYSMCTEILADDWWITIFRSLPCIFCA